MGKRVALLLLIGMSGTAFAQQEQTAQGDVSITVYNNNLALVQDIRQINLPAGRIRQEFPDVSAQIRPETVTLGGEGFGVVEQNFDYDLLSPGKLMEKAVGQMITLVRIIPSTGAEVREQAKVLAVNGGVVLQIGSRIEVLRDDGMPVRVIFDKVPANLRARPTLSVTLQSSKAAMRPISLSYLTPSLGWKADYVARFDEGKGVIDMQGWVTMTNNTGTTFHNAQTYLVAGAPSSNGYGNYGYDSSSYNSDPGRMTRAGTQTANRERLGDFYIYPLAERTTVANAQQKQVSFLDVVNVPAHKVYEYRAGWLETVEQPRSVSTAIKFSTSSQGGLGDALPAGAIRFYVKDKRGQPQFIGENTIGHTPMGSELSIKTGDAFDVRFSSVVASRAQIASDEWVKYARYRIVSPKADEAKLIEAETRITYYKSVMKYTFTNARDKAETVDFQQSGINPWQWWTDTRISDETIKGEQISADMRQWHVPVPANGKTELTVTYLTRF